MRRRRSTLCRRKSWVAVLCGIGQYRGSPPACAWVRAIVRHEAIHQAMRQRRDVPLSAERNASDPPRRQIPFISSDAGLEDDEHRRQLVRILLEVVDRLPETYRQVIQMRDIEERTPAAVAARLHISRSSVSSRLHRAHILLRQRLLRRLRMETLDT